MEWRSIQYTRCTIKDRHAFRMSVFEKYGKKWNSDRLFRSTAERKALYDQYVATRAQASTMSNITDCVPPARVKGKVQPRRAFDEEEDLWRATDFWREALRVQTSGEDSDSETAA